MITKELRKNKKYLEFIREQPCMVCGNKAEPHHEAFGTSGMGIKGPDTWTVPLCRKCHEKREQRGRDLYWKVIGIDPKLIIMELQTRYIHQLDLDITVLNR